MQSSEVRIFNSLDILADMSLEWLIEKTNQQQQVTVALSGGRTPQSLFVKLRNKDWSKVKLDRLKLFWGDERCVSPENNESNFANAKRALLSDLSIPEENIFRIHGENEPVAETGRYTQVMAEHVPLHDEFPQFDLVVLGLGDDGHTASIFPGHEDLFDVPEWCVVTRHPQTGQRRITLTGSLINNAKEVAFLVTGYSKAVMVAEMAETKRTTSYPADRVKLTNGKCRWYLDKEASSMLRI
jgi:6-phosphogluconolactonase